MRSLVITLALLLVAVSCGKPADDAAARVDRAAAKNAAILRAARRAYDGAPPVVPHRDFKADCGECHGGQGVEVAGVGYSPPSPHGATAGLEDPARCRQCHVFAASADVFRESLFVGLRQDLRKGRRHHDLAPPVVPHPYFMRENCLACHSGSAAREEIRCSHPERIRCAQCHLEQTETGRFP